MSDVKDARALTVGVYLGDAKGQYLADNGFENLSAAENDRLILRKLLLGRVDLMVIDDSAIVQLLKDEGIDPARVKRALPIPDLSGQVYMAFNKDTDANLAKQFREGLHAIKASGLHDSILAKYLLIN